MSNPNRPTQDTTVAVELALAAKRRRLGTALHQLAVDLARERRRVAQLERELASLRSAGPRAPSRNGAEAGGA
jgi:hypothetical protein